MSAPTFLAGARSRLLPPSLPFRFFLAATGFHVAAWGLLAVFPEALPGFSGGLGPGLAALHLFTLGVLTMTAMGAAIQLLPIATMTPLSAHWPVKAIFVAMVGGVPLLAWGMASGRAALTVAGAVPTVAAVVGFAGLLALNLARTPKPSLPTRFATAAVVALIATAVLGGLVAVDFEIGVLDDHGRVAALHFVVAVFGFFGLLVMGFSLILLPMFALAPAPAPGPGRIALAAVPAALAAAIAGIWFDLAAVRALAAVVGLAAFAGHVWAIETALKRRMRRRLDLAVATIRWGEGALAVALVLVGLSVIVPVPGGATLIGWIAIVGGLGTILFGVLQRIVPFLTTMHFAGARAPLPSELAPVELLRAHATGHGAAVVGAALGIVAASPLAVRIAAVAGLAGAIAFLVFAVRVVMRLPRAAAAASSAPDSPRSPKPPSTPPSPKGS